MADEHGKTVNEHGGEESDDDEWRTMTPSELDEYYDMIKESDGFDIDGEKFKGVFGFGLICALPEIPEFVMKILTRLSSYALKKHNEEQGTELELVRVIKANTQAVSGFRYFITLEAKDMTQNELKVYQLRLVHGIGDDNIEVEMLRLKPSSSPQVSPPPPKKVSEDVTHMLGINESNIYNAFKDLMANNWDVHPDDVLHDVQKALSKSTNDKAAQEILANVYRAAKAVEKFTGILTSSKMELDDNVGLS